MVCAVCVSRLYVGDDVKKKTSHPCWECVHPEEKHDVLNGCPVPGCPCDEWPLGYRDMSKAQRKKWERRHLVKS